MLPILCSRITKTNIGLKVLNYLPVTLTDFPPQAMLHLYQVCSVLTWQHLQDLPPVIGRFAVFKQIPAKNS